MISDGKWHLLKKKDFWRTSFKLVMISDWKADEKGVLASKDRNDDNFFGKYVIRMKNGKKGIGYDFWWKTTYIDEK